MPQRLFNFGAASIAKLHLATGRPLEELAELAFSSYRDAYVEDGAERDWAEAAQEAIELLAERDAPAPEELLNHFQYFLDNYEPDGTPREKRFLGGTRFTGAEQNARRKEDFISLLESYYIGARAGLVPLAPPGWPKNR